MARLLNHYTCPRCAEVWSDEWDCMADDDCPACGLRHISPHDADELEEDEEEPAPVLPALPDRAPRPLALHMRADAIAAGHPYVFRVLIWCRVEGWRTFCHYRERDPRTARTMAHDMARALHRDHDPRCVLVAQDAMPGSPELIEDWEAVELADGPALQKLVAGVAPVPLAARQVEALQRQRAERRGDAPLPSGGLFDDVARAQQDLFA